MENAIYNELRCRGYLVDVGVIGIREYKAGKREYKQLEIDFVANKGSDGSTSNLHIGWMIRISKNRNSGPS